jgi:hypothetical protein
MAQARQAPTFDSGDLIMTRGRRRLVVVLGVILVPAVLLWGAARYLLASHRVAPLLASRLQAAIGGPVDVGSAEIGLGGSSAQDLQFLEAGTNTGNPPWMVIRNLEADVSLWDLIGGDPAPRQLNVDGLEVMLRLDHEGHLVTHFPSVEGQAGAWPDFSISRGQITLRQEGRADFVISGVNATAHADNNSLTLAGTVADPTWGDWAVACQLDRQTDSASLTLKSASRHVTQSQLARLPFVPAKAWQQVQCEGDTPVELTVQVDPVARRVHYRVELAPVNTQVHVRSIDLEAQEARGTVVIEDGVVSLLKVRGKAAGGDMETTATLDFRPKPARMHFDIRTERVELARLPRKWHLPSQLNGRLTGQAALQVTVLDGKARTHGDGRGVIAEATLAGLHLNRPIKLMLRADEKGFHFSRDKTPSDSSTRLPLTGQP